MNCIIFSTSANKTYEKRSKLISKLELGKKCPSLEETSSSCKGLLFLSYPQLAQELLTKEVLNYDDVAAILGPCPFGDKRTRFTSPEAASQPAILSS